MCYLILIVNLIIMTNKPLRKSWILVLLSVSLVIFGCSQTLKDDYRSNIVLIMVDDMGYSDIGCYGGEIETPNIDNLAYTGIRFSNFYNNAICVPTRASLLTGMYPQKAGVYTNEPKKYKNSVTLAEVLKEAGYRTLMVGKWHAEETPYQRGFERHFGLCDGAANHFNPGPKRMGEREPGRKISTVPRGYPRRWAVDGQEFEPYVTKDSAHYSTDTYTDYALDYLEEYKHDEKPFFLYVAYTAPHYPLHAWPGDIEKYRGKYLKGWDSLRVDRFRRLKDLGLIPENILLCDRDNAVPQWEDIENKDEWDLTMAVYAAMIDRVDQNVGRILNKLDELGERENTLIVFLSDNGGCAEDANYTPNIAPGPVESYRSVGKPWAIASNTPYKKYKKWCHEGGIKTPMIVNWPKYIKQPKITEHVGHIIDFMPTLLDIAEADYPTEYNGQTISPYDGKSLLPVILGNEAEGHDVLYWQSSPKKQRAIRKGKWKLVSEGENYGTELYNLEEDLLEENNVSKLYPEVVQELDSLFYIWSKSVGSGQQEYIEK